MAGVLQGSFASPELVIAGQLSRDVLVIDGRRQPPTVGGSVYYAAFATRPAGARVLVIPKLALRDYGLLSELWARGLAVLPAYSERTTLMEDIFERQRGYTRWSRILELAAPFGGEEIPVPRADIFYLAGLIHGEFPEPLLSSLAERGKVALDAQAVLRHLEGERVVYRDWEQKEECLPKVHFLKADMEEARLLTGAEAMEEILTRIHWWGVREAVITDKGGVTVSGGGQALFRPFPAYSTEARTGRGDTCFASYLSWRLHHGLPESLEHAALITARKLKRPGPYLE
jgi:sugar/nucleoside kinase (ribokinase family)